MKYAMLFGCLTAAVAVTAAAADDNHSIKTVFVIPMENHNWTQPTNQFSGPIQQIFQNPNAPFINALVSGSSLSTVTINGRPYNISKQVAYASNYRNVLATSGTNPHIHPSEPNYLWAEAGTNFGVFDDNDPFAFNTNGTNQVNDQDNQLHLSRLLTAAGRTWRSYQEDIDLVSTPAGLTNTVLPKSGWTSPIISFSGNFVSGFNAYNGSTQYNYAVKHNPPALFTDSNGGDDTTTNNPARLNFAPLQQLFVDLGNNTVADYNWITPDQYNDQHTALKNGFQGLTGDAANIKQGDNFLSIVVPQIIASRAYQDNGVIVIWWDETEQDTATDNPDDLTHTIGEIVISPLAHPNVNGVPYASPVFYTHSSDLLTWQKVFHATKPIILGDAINANDLSDLFAPGVIPPDDKDGDKH